MFQGFQIDDAETISELRQHCEYVYIDIERGAIPDPAPSPRSVSDIEHDTAREEIERVLARPVVSEERYPVVISVSEELKSARQSRDESVEAVTAILSDVKAGRKIQIEAVRKSVGAVVDSIIRNPDAFMWLTRLKNKDSYAYAHCVDACGLAVAFGRHLGFPKVELENLAIGTLLFDIGKLQLPDSLLKKPDKLSKQEFALIRRHVEFGADLVREMSGVNDDIVSIVMTHHERHDGSGYPANLSGHAIPVTGRIAALVDCYDAITSERPYCPAMNTYDAVRLIYQWRDKDFQAELVEQFIQCIGLYPTGTLVELSNGAVGIVLSQNRVRRLCPKIMLVLDEDKQPYEFNPVLDLIEESSESEKIYIHHPLDPGSYGIDANDFYL